MDYTFRVLDFNVYETAPDEESGDPATFAIQIFGLNEQGKTCSIVAEDYKPFFYVMVDDTWSLTTKTNFLDHIKTKIKMENAITDCIIVKRKKLYGFDAGRLYKFVKFEFANMAAFNKAKNLWYTDYKAGHVLLRDGYKFNNTNTKLYEANIPPLLRFLHIRDVSPSGWIALPKKHLIEVTSDSKKTTCDLEFIINYKNIVPLNDKETRVRYKICSFDIEASSSHGDFPVPKKTYKKLATNIVEYFENDDAEKTKDSCKTLLTEIVRTAFGYGSVPNIDVVYSKRPPKSLGEVDAMIAKWLEVRGIVKTEEYKETQTLEAMFERMAQGEDEEEYPNGYVKKEPVDKMATIVDIMCDKKYERDSKLEELNKSLISIFPSLKGDEVTFIGSTFMYYGDENPYKNNCMVVNTCSDVENSELEVYKTEREMLLGWQKMIQRENPDIIIGYNIFGFDYEFMFRRAEENGCIEEFLKLSRNKDEICATKDWETGRYKMEESTLQIASGQHDLKFIKINGRLQIDLYNFFRREENLSSYKLDYVAGHFIGDYVKEFSSCEAGSEIKTTNMTGLLEGSFVHFEEIGHTVDYYNDGAKYKVIKVDKAKRTFQIDTVVKPDMSKKVRWCLAKDDVTPKDIFQMTNGTADDRAVIAKYCIQDCNIVHYLFNKSDVLTGFIEMAKICSVPINFLVMRGQGIKLTSFVAKKCREKKTLMPVIEKGGLDDGYEGAIVLPPKSGLYLDKPVACVDYASLYPSSMISENLSHDSKVWTMEYDLAGNLIEEWGEKDAAGNFMYDNLPGYEYVDITYDTYRYVRKTPAAAAEKVKSGHKICRFVQEKAIMPSILEELLMARKTTRKQIPLETDDFMKNVLDKRQLGYKVTANSLYGQCGAKTSTFYEKDIAACTTATGRMLLTYAKKIVEQCYGDAIVNTENHGPVLTKAEYIYGDSVTNYTPVYVKVNDKLDICTIEEIGRKYGNDNWLICKEEGKQEKEFCELTGVTTWTERGWTQLHRVIRHTLAPHKKIIRILTHTGLVDVTDDHSLLTPNGIEVSPKDVCVGTELLHCNCSDFDLFDIVDNRTENVSHTYAAAAYHYLTNVLGYNVNITSGRTPDLVNLIIDKDCVPNKGTQIVSMTEMPYTGFVYDLTTENHHFAAGIGSMIVHNTDSVFFTFNLETPEGKPIRGKEALEITIEIAQQAGHLASSHLKAPHDLEYEKTFMPFCLLSKKRYVGMLYETDPNKCKRKEMGIVLKRRDNAPIVKDIYGGIIDILMKEQNIQKAIDFLKSCLQNIVDEKYPMDKLIITKSLRSGYKNPKSIAHKVLADRITARDPGSKPSSGDRIPFVYINTTNKKALQGEKIETPTYITEHGLKIDYAFYITNQIMKPVQQVFALVLEKIWEMQNKKPKIQRFRKEVELLRQNTDEEKFEDKLEQLKNKEVKALLFDDYLRDINNDKQGNQSLLKFFGKK
jgi:DNA polymerase elongation subunit (family B)